MISAQSTKLGGQNFDIYSLKLSSDVVNVEYQPINENNKPENETEFDNLEVLMEKIKNILLVQVFYLNIFIIIAHIGRTNEKTATYQTLQLTVFKRHEK